MEVNYQHQQNVVPGMHQLCACKLAVHPSDVTHAGVQPALVAASTTAINALTALVSSSGSTAAALSGEAALSVVSTLLSLTANPAAVSPAAAPAALAGAC